MATWSSGSEQKLKRDDAVSEAICRLCHELKEKLLKEDPAKGVQSIPSTQQWKVRCDTSDHALGVMLGTEVHVVEDATCLRSAHDRRHINVAELELAINAIGLVAAWQVHKVSLMTDSKTLAGWLQWIAGNTRHVMVGCLHEVLVKRRLHVVKDLVQTTGMEVAVVWVPSADNRPNQLTIVPCHWIAAGKKEEQLHGTKC